MGTALEHPVPDRVKPTFVIFDFQRLRRSASRQIARISKITDDGLTPVWHSMLCSCTYMATVGVKGLTETNECMNGMTDGTRTELSS